MLLDEIDSEQEYNSTETATCSVPFVDEHDREQSFNRPRSMGNSSIRSFTLHNKLTSSNNIIKQLIDRYRLYIINNEVD